MRALIGLLAVCILFGTSCAGPATDLPARSTASYVDVTADWNALAGYFNFTPGPWTANQTFSDTYTGSDFTHDLQGIWNEIRYRNWTELQGITLPPMDDDDIISIDLVHIDY